MEDTLRVPFFITESELLDSLYPCFNGRYSQRLYKDVKGGVSSGLNPCFNGRYSQRIEC